MSDGPVQRTTSETIEERHWRAAYVRVLTLLRGADASADRLAYERDELRVENNRLRQDLDSLRTLVEELNTQLAVEKLKGTP